MSNQNKIKLYQVRNFNENFDVFLKFLKQNYLSIIKKVIYVIPLILIASYFLIDVNSFTSKIDSYDYQNADFLFSISKIIIGYVFYIIASLIISIYSVCYMVQYSENDEVSIDNGEVWNRVKKTIIPLIGAGILYGLAVTFGLILFIIPGIVISVYLIFYQFCYVAESETSITDSLARSWNLIQNNWWRTLGFIMAVGIIVSIVSFIFSIPTQLSSIGSMFHINFFNNTIYKYITTFISYTSMLLLLPINIMATGILYFSRRSDYDDVELYNDIDDHETSSEEKDIN